MIKTSNEENRLNVNFLSPLPVMTFSSIFLFKIYINSRVLLEDTFFLEKNNQVKEMVTYYFLSEENLHDVKYELQ